MRMSSMIRMALSVSLLGVVLWRSLPTVEAAQKTLSLAPVRLQAPTPLLGAQRSRLLLPQQRWDASRRLTRKPSCERWTPSSLRAAIARKRSGGDYRGISPLGCTRG